MILDNIPIRNPQPGAFEVVRDPRDLAAGALWHDGQRWTWRRATFTVPASVPNARVQDDGMAVKYRNKWGAALEAEGFYVHGITRPVVDEDWVLKAALSDNEFASDRRPYVMWARVSRPPRTIVVDVPDSAVPMLLEHGMRLKD